MAQRIDTYGDIVHPDYKLSTLESLKHTAANLLADELAYNRSETFEDALSYVEQWYYFDYDNRCWRPK